jgi:hypothetical protein
LVVLLVLLGGASVAAHPATAADARLTLTDATVTPDTPAAGAPITVSTTARLSAGSDTPLSLNSVRVVRAEGDGTLVEATDLGTLSPGETLSVPVTFAVEEPRVHDLELVVAGTDEDGETARATRPLTVGAEVGAPQFEIETDRLVAGADLSVGVEVANPTTAPLRGIELRVTDPASDPDPARRTIPTLAPGATQTVNLTVRGPAPGETELAVATTYTDPTGAERTATHARPVDVAALSVDVGVRAERVTSDSTQQVPGGLGGLVGGGSALQSQSDDGEDGTEQVEVTVTNFGNAPIGDVVLTGRTGDGAVLASVGRFALADALASGESATATVDLSRVRGIDGLRFVASYATPDGRTESALAYDYSAARGAVAVTGLDVTTEDGAVSLGGNLANTGSGEITSAVVAVRPTDHVDPAYPRRTYFVGTVGASEFAPFDLTARADTANATAVTLRVAYTTGGERFTETVRAPLRNGSASTDDSGTRSQSMLLPAVLLVVVIVAGGVLVARRGQR